MIEKAAKCALKRTSKAVVMYGLSVSIAIAAFLAIVWVVSIAITTVEKYYPILHDISAVCIPWCFAFIILFVMVYAIHEEYKCNYKVCKQSEKEKKE